MSGWINLKAKVKSRLPAVVQIDAFRRLWIGQGVSQFGDALFYIVFLYVVDKSSKDPTHTGYAGALMQLPYLLFGFHAGVAADRVDRRKIMLWSDYGSVILMALLLIASVQMENPPSPFLFLIGFMLSAVAAFFDPARNASIPNIVPPKQLIDANAISTSTKTLMQLFGPLLSTVFLPLFATAGTRYFLPIAIAVNMVTFAYSAYAIYLLPKIEPKRDDVPAERPTVIREFFEGLQFIRTNETLRTGLLLTLAVNLLVAPILVAYTAANREWFQESERTFAGMQAAFFLGVIASSLIVMRLKIRRPGLSYGLGLLIGGVFIATLSVAKHFWMFAGLNFLCGLAVPFAVIPLQTYLQMICPDSLRGRVNSTLNMFTNILLPIGWIGAGWLIKGIGISGIFIVIGGGLSLTGMVALMLPKFRASEMPETTGEFPNILHITPEPSEDIIHPPKNQ